ncbi:hypothetical protein QQF64_030281, partial [Cirrhinus molitorella]
MPKRRTTQGLQRKTECESRSLIAMQMTRVYPLDSEDDVRKQRRVNDFRRPRSSWRALQTQEQETRWAPQGSH